MNMLSRRSLLSAVPALICAPAIVRASSLMPVKAWDVVSDDCTTGSLLRYDQHRLKLLAESVWRNNALLERLKQRRFVITDAQWSGRVIIEEFAY